MPFVHKRLIYDCYLNKLSNQAIGIFSKNCDALSEMSFQYNGNSHLLETINNAYWKLLVFEDNLKLESIYYVRDALQIDLHYDYRELSKYNLTSSEAKSGFLSLLVNGAVEWFKASEGGTKKGLLESREMKKFKRKYLISHGVSAESTKNKKWEYDRF